MNVYEFVFVLLCVDLITSAAPWKTPSYRLLFFFKFLEDISPFCGATDPWFGLLVTSPLGSKPEWAALFTLGGGVHVTCSLRFTSGVTPADLLVASMATDPSLPNTCKQALVGLEAGIYHAAPAWATVSCTLPWRIYIVKLWTIPLSSFSCSFQEYLAK